MCKIKVLIADDNLLAAQRLIERLGLEEELAILGVAKDGLETIEWIQREKPDVVLLDIIMPKLDGIGVLEFFRAHPELERPIFIVFSAISQESYVTRVMNLGANYYIIKPFDENVIATRIRQWYSDLKKDNMIKPVYQVPTPPRKAKPALNDELRLLATKYMRESGLKAHMTGYSYIRDIIMDSFDSYCRNGVLPKGIFRTIAHQNNVPLQKVERAIRNCIENGIDENELGKRPTNSQVICSLIEKIRINE